MKLRHWWHRVILGLLLIPAMTLPAHADGGPILDDPELWALLREGMQIAVVRLGEEADTAQVDLFVSLLDTSGESHQITFFIPLGSQPTDFDVLEENSYDFEEALTEELDDHLADAVEREENYKWTVRLSLLPGTLLINGAWYWPCGLIAIVSGFGMVGAMQGPAATFETEHSVIQLYDIDADTDLQALVATTGLDPAVQETLRRYEGQQIAVITMETQPAGEGGVGIEYPGHYGIAGQQGLHLAWKAGLVPGDEGGTYAYPLGTGSAWARPIEITRVYVAALPGADFRVAYPELGEDRSGYTSSFYGGPKPRILHNTSTPGYAVDQAVGDFGRVWRATYVQSNATENVTITRVEDLLPETRAELRRLTFQRSVMLLTWAIGLLAALSIWIFVWRLVVSRRLGFPHRWLDLRFWRHALGWALVYPLSNIASLIVGTILVSLAFGCGALLGQLSEDLGDTVGAVLVIAMAVVAMVLLALTSFSIVSGFLFVLVASRRQSISWGQAVRAYVLAIASSNVCYGLFALAYLALVGGL
jgi:hypothetical protein